ncbi:hypothetical protein HYS54_00035 [Candidatus Micrarchaeota archaeon]|nr:hypothetical protein [Candidatus Micrarchaeota archaeon]
MAYSTAAALRAKGSFGSSTSSRVRRLMKTTLAGVIAEARQALRRPGRRHMA